MKLKEILHFVQDDDYCHVERSEASLELEEILHFVQDDDYCHVERSETSLELEEILHFVQDDRKINKTEWREKLIINL